MNSKLKQKFPLILILINLLIYKSHMKSMKQERFFVGY